MPMSLLLKMDFFRIKVGENSLEMNVCENITYKTQAL